MIEESANSTNKSGSAATNAPQRYTDAANTQNQPRLTDLLPRRGWSLAVIVLTALVLVNLVGLGYLYFLNNAEQVTALLDLQNRASLGKWLSAVICLATSLLCLQIFSLKRHRIDDYKGRYRIWVTLGLLLLVCSADRTTGLFQTAGSEINQIVGQPLQSGPTLVAVFVYVLLSWVLIRVLLEVRSHKVTLFWIAMCTVTFGSFATFKLPALSESFGAFSAFVSEYGNLLGHWAMFAGALTFSRFIVRDVEISFGIIAPPVKNQRQPKPNALLEEDNTSQERAKTKSADSVAKTSTGKPSPPISTATRRRRHQQRSESQPSKSQSSANHHSETTEEPQIFKAPSQPRLSKAEKKRLRKEKRRQARAA